MFAKQMYFQIALIETPRDSYIIRIQLGLHNGNNARSLKLFRLSFKLDAVTFRIGIGICKGGVRPKEALARLHLVHAPLQEHFISSLQALDTSGMVIHFGTHLPSSSNHENCPGDGTGS